ncbi:hypothetical protein EXIGLDRAFT_837246 [Exidia glandulosa HHB12029]|uniref:ABM domain-containing protein n=1 Tax=Exidia glandulosa HHB12029 TaxID=1314781 RepID=A0A165H0U0_EXIGL|nr:hypothetical protein EXIGLDRAFT_837246 [Exidia glandulosa HHB12029]
MPTTEIVSFVLAEGADMNPAFAILARQPGCIGHSGGRILDDPKTLCWFIHWRSLEDHERFMGNAIEYPALHSALEGKMVSPPKILHVDLEPFGAMRAPVLDVHFVNEDYTSRDANSSSGKLVEDGSLTVVVVGAEDLTTPMSNLDGEVQRYRVPITGQWWPGTP